MNFHDLVDHLKYVHFCNFREIPWNIIIILNLCSEIIIFKQIFLNINNCFYKYAYRNKKSLEFRNKFSKGWHSEWQQAVYPTLTSKVSLFEKLQRNYWYCFSMVRKSKRFALLSLCKWKVNIFLARFIFLNSNIYRLHITHNVCYFQCFSWNYYSKLGSSFWTSNWTSSITFRTKLENIKHINFFFYKMCHNENRFFQYF